MPLASATKFVKKGIASKIITQNFGKLTPILGRQTKHKGDDKDIGGDVGTGQPLYDL